MNLTAADGHTITARLFGGVAAALGLAFLAVGALFAVGDGRLLLGLVAAGAGTLFVLMGGVAFVVAD